MLIEQKDVNDSVFRGKPLFHTFSLFVSGTLQKKNIQKTVKINVFGLNLIRIGTILYPASKFLRS